MIEITLLLPSLFERTCWLKIHFNKIIEDFSGIETTIMERIFSIHIT